MRKKAIFMLAAGTLCAVIFHCRTGKLPSSISTDNAESGEIKVMTYNVLCRFCKLKPGWKTRVKNFGEIFREYKPDILAAQEIFFKSIDARQILKQLPDADNYEYVCAGGNCDSAVYYRRNRFEKLGSGYINLPRGVFKRTMVWVYLKEKDTGARFLAASTHFSNNRSRETSADEFVKRVGELGRNSVPMILMGDYNSSLTGKNLKKNLEKKGCPQPASDIRDRKKSYEILSRNFTNALNIANQCRIAFSISEPGKKPLPDPAKFTTDQLIDHLFLKSPAPWTWEVSQWTTHFKWKTKNNPSDHWPVMAKVRLKRGGSPLAGGSTDRVCKMPNPVPATSPATCHCP